MFLRSKDDSNWARGAVAGDTTERIYFTGFRDNPSGAATPAVPKLTNNNATTGAFGSTIHTGQTAGHYPNNWYLLGVPDPNYGLAVDAAKPTAQSTPISSTTLFAEGATANLEGGGTWTTSGTVNFGNSVIEAASTIELVSANAYIQADAGVGDATNESIQFEFRWEDATPTIEDAFYVFAGVSSVGAGPAVKISANRAEIGVMTTFAGGITNVNNVVTLATPLVGDVTYTCIVGYTKNSDDEWEFSVRVLQGTSQKFIFSNRFAVPQGTYFGVRKGTQGTAGNEFYVNDVYTSKDNATDDLVSTSYVYTWVNGRGEESAPSPASEIVDKSTGLTTAIGNITDPTAQQKTDYFLAAADGATKRLYRAATGADGSTSFLFVATIAIGTTTYTDTITDANLGEELETEDWGLPPANGHSILSLPNGITVMASGNQVCPSAQNRPHAYPSTYRLTTDFDVIGYGAIDTTLVVLTKAFPYLVIGSDPAALSMTKLEAPYSCTNKKSIGQVSGLGVVYSSPDGLVAINGSGVNLITKDLFTREQWQALVPSSIVAFVHDDKYFFFYNTGSVLGGYMIDPVQHGNGLTLIDLSIVSGFNNAITAAYSDPITDTLHFIHSTNKLATWNSDSTNLTYTWTSKTYKYPYPVEYSMVQIKAPTYTPSITLTISADGATQYTGTPTSKTEFVIGEVTASDGADEVVFTVSSKSSVESVEIVEAVEEFT